MKLRTINIKKKTTISGVELEEVKDFRYLGSYISPESDIKRVRALPELPWQHRPSKDLTSVSHHYCMTGPS